MIKRILLTLIAALELLAPLPLDAETPKIPKVGEPLPPFSLKDARGIYQSIGKLRGDRSLLLSFFQTDCAPCKAELPHLQEIFAGGATAVVLISEDARGHEAFAPFAAKHKITFPVLHDAMGIVKVRLGVSTLPQAFLVDRAGVIREILSSFDTKDERASAAELRQKVAALASP